MFSLTLAKNDLLRSQNLSFKLDAVSVVRWVLTDTFSNPHMIVIVYFQGPRERQLCSLYQFQFKQKIENLLWMLIIVVLKVKVE